MDADVLDLQIPMLLESPNTDRGRHWRAKYSATKRWEEAIAVYAGGHLTPFTLIADERAVRTRQGFVLKTRRRKARRRVIVTRYVAHQRQLLTDDDNLRYVAKPILDALKRLGVIYDDRREWLDHPAPTQEVSADGTDWTRIRLERLA